MLDRTIVQVYVCSHMAVAEQIKQARADAGFTQQQLADKIGATKRSIAYWEGNGRQPEFVYVVRIARATGKPLDYFAESVA